MTNSLIVPTEPQHWCNNPRHYVKHQQLLQKLVDYLAAKGEVLELPEETPGHDNGIDLLVGESRLVVDLKSFWLTDGPRTRTWKSTYHAGNSGRKSTWAGKATEIYIHADFNVPVEQWLVCRASDLRMSYTGGAPFYYRNRIQTVKSWATAWGRSL